jgi:hypothetical protein
MAWYKYRFNRERTFGVEIECVLKNTEDRDSLLGAIRATGVRAEDIHAYEHTRNSHGVWIIKDDGSLVYGGVEVVTPILKGEDGLADLRKVVAVIARYAKIDKRCGLHVHHGASDLTGAAFIRLYKVWERNQNVINYLVAPSRRNNGYCNALADHFPDRYRNGCRPLDVRSEIPGRIGNAEGRAAVNFQSYTLRGTIEFRQHHGTLNIEKMIAWLVFTQACMEFTMNGRNASIARSMDHSQNGIGWPIKMLLWKVGMSATSEDALVRLSYKRMYACFLKFWNHDHGTNSEENVQIEDADGVIATSAPVNPGQPEVILGPMVMVGPDYVASPNCNCTECAAMREGRAVYPDRRRAI